MKKHLLSIATISAMLSVNVISADAITFYEQPDLKAGTTQLNAVPSNLLLIKNMPGDWVKVADKSSGSVGFMQLKTFQDFTANQAATSPSDGLKVFMATYNNTANGLPKIVVYENGQRLSDEQAQKMYQQMNEKFKKLNTDMANNAQLLQKNIAAANQQMQDMLTSLQSNIANSIPTIVVYMPQKTAVKTTNAAATVSNTPEKVAK